MKITEHPMLARTMKYCEEVRTCMIGEDAVKEKGAKILKPPTVVDLEPKEAARLYDRYLDGAEFDDIPKTTLTKMLGKMLSGEISAELPEGIEYLTENWDGDGMSLMGASEVIYSELLQMGFYVLVAEFQDLSSLDLDKLNQAEYEEMNPRASVKLYRREALKDIEFSRRNGVMQISMMLLEEVGTFRDDDGTAHQVTSYLRLALDENGQYYQQKIVKKKDGTEDPGDPYYPLAKQEKLKWIPAEIVCESETPAGTVPERLGFIRAIVAASLHRYRVSADYKLALWHMPPTTFTSGWKDGDIDLFKAINGRENLAFGLGVANHLPDGVTVDVKGLGIETEHYLKFFELNESKLRALGASTDEIGSQSTMSATQAAIIEAGISALMTGIVKNTEAAMKRMVSYCAMFQGLWKPDQVEENLDKINIKLPRSFGIKISPDEIRATIEAVNAGILPRTEGTRKLVEGGFTVADATKIFDELEGQGGPVV